MHSQTNLDNNYIKALEWTCPSKHKIPEPGSEQERAILKRLENLYINYSYENLKKDFPNVYARELFFRDAFRHFERLDDLVPYMLKGVQAVSGVKFVFNQVIRSNNEFFIEWTMSIRFKIKHEFESSIGLSRFRFNSEGKVIFHQDYWDPTTLIYKKIPIAKQLIQFVQKLV